MNIGQSIYDYENWRDSQHDRPPEDPAPEPDKYERRQYTHDYPNDTTLEYILHDDSAMLRMTFTSEDTDLGTEEMVYCGDHGESMTQLVDELRQELSAFLDAQDHSSFYEQQGQRISDGIHDVADYYGEFSRTALYAFEEIMRDYEREVDGSLRWNALESDKADWVYSSRGEADAERGCVGHLRGDFGRDGTEFWTSWFDHQPQWKSSEFRDELQHIVNQLRRKGGLLCDFASMLKGCDTGRTMDGSYGFHAESAHNEYCLRCIPRRGDYNFYLYCYSKDAQREHARSKETERTPGRRNPKAVNKEMER